MSESWLAARFLEIIPVAMREIRLELRGTCDLSVSQFRILVFLKEGAKTNKELAELQGLSTPAMSRVIQNMVKQGLINKLEGAEDRRENRLVLSSQGKKVLERIHQSALKVFAKRFQTLTSSQRQSVAEALVILASVLDSQAAQGKPD